MLYFIVALIALLVGAPAVEAAAPRITTGDGTPLPDPPPPPAAGTGSIESASYKALVFGRLQAVNHMGEMRRSIPAVAGIHFKIGDDGALLEAKIVVPSGNPAYDASVVAMVRKAAPFPPPPPGAQREFDATIKFSPKHKS